MKDNWQGRSNGIVCGTCVFYVPEKSDNPVNAIGRCRRNAPTMKGFPVVYPRDWCGEHRVDENKLTGIEE